MEKDKKSIVTYSGKLLSFNNIIRIEETNNDTLIFLENGTSSKSVLSIDVLEWKLPKDIFIRVHPKHLININFSKKLFTVHTQWIELENGEKIPITKELTQNKNLFQKSKNAFEWLKNKIIR